VYALAWLFSKKCIGCEKRHTDRNVQDITFYYMKLTTLTAAIAVFFVAGSSYAHGHRPVSVLTVRNDLFYFKVDKAFIGAVVEVYASSGELVMKQTVTRHKMLIDFYDRNNDDYTIRIKSACAEISYLYSKIDPAGIDKHKPSVRQISSSLSQ
jgi:hypothetical protein